MPIVQFFHPKEELDCPVPNGRVPWNRGQHHRRFLATKGQYLTQLDPAGKHEIRKGEIQFWGEWEAETFVRKISDRRAGPGYPLFVHRPIIPTSNPEPSTGTSACESGCGEADTDAVCAGFLNTDPCVLSDPHSPTPIFLYSNCRQAHFRNRLRGLHRGDVILFGSHDHYTFILDTVFVVEEAYPYSSSDVQGNAQIRSVVPGWYYPLTLNLLPPGHNYVLYIGATINNPVNGMFSFFPCSTFDRHPRGFARPTTLKHHEPCYQTRGINGNFHETPKQLWNQAVEDVLKAGLCLGVRADV